MFEREREYYATVDGKDPVTAITARPQWTEGETSTSILNKAAYRENLTITKAAAMTGRSIHITKSAAMRFAHKVTGFTQAEFDRIVDYLERLPKKNLPKYESDRAKMVKEFAVRYQVTNGHIYKLATKLLGKDYEVTQENIKKVGDYLEAVSQTVGSIAKKKSVKQY